VRVGRAVTSVSILRVTLDGVALEVLRVATGVVVGARRSDPEVVCVLRGVTVRVARLLLLVPRVDRVLLEVVGATSTVRFTGRERVARLRVDGTEAGRDGAGCGAGRELGRTDREGRAD